MRNESVYKLMDEIFLFVDQIYTQDESNSGRQRCSHFKLPRNVENRESLTPPVRAAGHKGVR